MRKPKSKYVLAKIRSLPFSRFAYVEDLLLIEAFVLNPPRSMSAGWCEDGLRRKYPDEYAAICRELAPGRMAKEARERAAREAADRAEKKREAASARRQEARDRVARVRLGGRIR